MFCAIFSIIVGSFLALYQVKIKRFFAYSAIVHMGYIILSISLGVWFSIYSTFYYLLIYLVSCINIFMIFLVILKYNKTPIKNITDVILIMHSNFHLSFIFVFNLLSLAGIPPLAGFYGKLLVFYVLMQTGSYYILFLVVLLSVLSCVYYIRFIRFLWFKYDVNKKPISFVWTITPIESYLIVIGFFINFSLLILQGPLLIYIENILLLSGICYC